MTSEGAVVAVQQLSLRPNDLVIIQFDSSKMSAAKIGAIRKALMPDILQRKASLVMIPNDCKIEKVNERYMEQQGWVKKERVSA